MKRIAYLLTAAVVMFGAHVAWAGMDSNAPRSAYEASELAGQPPFPSRGGLIGD
jgi:hypothetical protein